MSGDKRFVPLVVLTALALVFKTTVAKTKDSLGMVIATRGSHDLNSIRDYFHRFDQVGLNCTKTFKPPMFLTYSDLTTETTDFHLQVSNLWNEFRSRECFGRFQVIHFTLPKHVQDDYPSGPNFHFLSIFFSEEASIIRDTVRYIFYSELDVFPLRIDWLQRLYYEVQTDFWIKGSVIQGHSWDHIAGVHSEQEWIGHINFNALFNVEEEEFFLYLRVVVQYEPPDDFWKPLDISLWRVMHNFPYTWPLYRRYRHKFQAANFISNFGGQMLPSSMENTLHLAKVRGSVLAHGGAKSAGVTHPKLLVHQEKNPNENAIGIREDIVAVVVNDVLQTRFMLENSRNLLPNVHLTIVHPQHLETEDFVLPDLAKHDLIFQALYRGKQAKKKYILLFWKTFTTRMLLRKDLMWLGKPILYYKKVFHNPVDAFLDIKNQVRESVIIIHNGPIMINDAVFSNINKQLALVSKDVPEKMCFHHDFFTVMGSVLWNYFQNDFWWIPMDAYLREKAFFPHPIIPYY